MIDDIIVTDALIEMLGDSVDSVTGVASIPPDKYYNPGSHITLKCIIRHSSASQIFTNRNTFSQGASPPMNDNNQENNSICSLIFHFNISTEVPC